MSTNYEKWLRDAGWMNTGGGNPPPLSRYPDVSAPGGSPNSAHSRKIAVISKHGCAYCGADDVLFDTSTPNAVVSVSCPKCHRRLRIHFHYDDFSNCYRGKNLVPSKCPACDHVQLGTVFYNDCRNCRTVYETDELPAPCPTCGNRKWGGLVGQNCSACTDDFGPNDLKFSTNYRLRIKCPHHAYSKIPVRVPYTPGDAKPMNVRCWCKGWFCVQVSAKGVQLEPKKRWFTREVKEIT
jgi:hypothetical protein